MFSSPFVYFWLYYNWMLTFYDMQVWLMDRLGLGEPPTEDNSRHMGFATRRRLALWRGQTEEEWVMVLHDFGVRWDVPWWDISTFRVPRN